MALNREQILASIAPSIIVTTVDGVGDLRIKQISEAQFYALSEAQKVGGGKVLNQIAVLSLVDDDGVPLLTNEDIPALDAGAFGPVEAILGAVAAANKIGGGEKNSVPTPAGDSSTA